MFPSLGLVLSFSNCACAEEILDSCRDALQCVLEAGIFSLLTAWPVRESFCMFTNLEAFCCSKSCWYPSLCWGGACAACTDVLWRESICSVKMSCAKRLAVSSHPGIAETRTGPKFEQIMREFREICFIFLNKRAKILHWECSWL